MLCTPSLSYGFLSTHLSCHSIRKPQIINYCCPVNSKEHKNPARSLVKPYFGLCFLKSKPPNRNELAPAALFASYLIIFFPFTMYTLLGNDADGLGLSRKRTIYMLKMGLKVSNRSVGRKDAHFRGFCQSADNQHVAKIKGHLALFCIHFCLL